MPAHKWSPNCPPPRKLVRPVRADASGGPTRGQVRGRGWRQTSYGFYVPSWVDSTAPEQRIMEQSVRLPPGGAATAWAAARLLSANFFDGVRPDGRTPVPVPLAIGQDHQIRRDALISLSREALPEGEVIVRHGIPCVRAPRATFDEVRRVRDLREAVVALDMMAAAELISLRRLRAYVEARAGWNGVPLVRAALDLADENSRSPNETRMRLIWQLDAGFPRPLLNQPVWDLDGRLLGIADLLDPIAGVIGEFDGADHRGARRHSKDVDREGRFRDHDLEFFRVTGPDIGDRPLVRARMASARARAKWLAEGRRRWTIVPPPGWERLPTLDEILDERDARAAMYAEWERQGDPDLRQLVHG